MSENKPCCAAAAAAQLRYLVVGGHRIAVARLDEILGGAGAKVAGGENAIRGELVRLVKIYNYVPPPAEKDYEDALYAEYLRSGSARGSDRSAKAEGAKSVKGGRPSG
jgi:hypothetical protein